MAVLYTNNAASTLSASITNTATSFSVTSGQGALFPAITGSDYFYVTLLDNSGNIEIVKVTARNTDTFTVTRAQDGTTARAWSANDKVELRITRSMLDDLKGERMPVYGPSVGSGGRVMLNMSGNPAWSDANFTYDVIMGQFRATSFRANVGDSAPTWNFNNILHAGNYSSYALPLTGGALTGLTSITGGSFDTTYTSTQTRFADGGVQAMKTVDAGVFEAIRAVNLATTAGTTVRLVAAATSDAFNNTNGGKVFIDAVRTATNMDLVFSLNATAGAAPTERVRFFGGGGIQLDGTNTVLHSGNYSSYAAAAGHTHAYLPLSGGTLTGGLSSNSAIITSSYIQVSNAAGYIENYGNYYARSDILSLNAAGNGWTTVFSRNAGSPFINNVTYNGSVILHAGNYTSYSPSLTGSGASGTWGISITGYGYGTSVLDTDRTIANRLPNSTPLSVRFDFANANAVGTGGNYAGVMTFSPWTGTTGSTGDASYQLVFGSTAANGGGNPLLRLRKGIDSTWNSWVDVLTSANISSYALPLTGGTLSGNLLIANAASPNTYYFQFGDNSGWKFRYMTNVSGTPTERFGFTDTGNFSAVGSVTWGSGNAAAVMNSGNPRSLAIGFSGGNYGGASYGVNYTTTSGSHTYAFADIVSRWDAYDGLIVYAAPSGTVGATVSWTNVLDARRSNASLIFKGNTVLDASNYTNYVAGLGGGNYTGTIQVTQSGVVDAFKSVNTSTTLTDESSLRFQKTMTPTGTATTNSLGGMEWEGKNSNGTSYEMARIYATNITSTSLDSGNYAVGELHLASYRYIGGYSESVRMRLSGGNIYWHFSGTERLRQDSAKIYPSTSGAYNLGDASFKFGTVFTNSITFGDGTTQSTGIPTTYTISYLVVAGGGGGGNSGNSGGGGGGGVLAANVSLAVGTTYSVTVGAGGAVNAVGGSSSFGLFATANGGGAGGAANAPGGNGGSGGGGGFMNAAQAGGSGTAGQGYAGGASTTAYGGGGGGGAGAVGNAGTGNGGNGGTGFTSSITGTTTVYGGGGGGGSNAGQGLGGSGGGGNGGPGTSTAGAVNTGGGGGGFGNTTVGRGGGSGVVILQIPTSNYTGLTTGSPTVTTSGSYTILKFTSSGSYTA